MQAITNFMRLSINDNVFSVGSLLVMCLTTFSLKCTDSPSCGKMDRCQQAIKSFVNGNVNALSSFLSESSLKKIPKCLNAYVGFDNLVPYQDSIDVSVKNNRTAVVSINDRVFQYKMDASCKLELSEEDLISLLWKNRPLRSRVADCLADEGNFDEALRWVMTSDDEANVSGIDNIGTYSSLEGKFEEHRMKHHFRDALRKSAHKGNVTAMVYLGGDCDEQGYFLGGSPPDDCQPGDSFKWYERAAKKGNSFAMQKVANAYEDGNGVEINLKKALQWYEKASNDGTIWPLLSLYSFYNEGKGCEKDPELAQQYFQKSIDLGKVNDNAALELGKSFETGKYGFSVDTAKAIYWYETAISLGDGLAAPRKLRNLKGQ